MHDAAKIKFCAIGEGEVLNPVFLVHPIGNRNTITGYDIRIILITQSNNHIIA